uniref:Ankyrin repeat domain-containing protein SOWAHC-like isoform X2 n=1 Tax=Geotrypetes seraphini TaxID=260995 RepID=A0A6P8SLC0_GEOSA|nr:ankyrin repeat domain-containing protein SOWAHC-like isoform X2 [Geotrypetes seraphini]
MEGLSEEGLLRFLVAEGGRARNGELLSRYREFINHGDPQLRAQHRETFKDIINKVAVVKQDAGEKYVILKKKYQSLITSAENTAKHDISVGPLTPDHLEGMVLTENQLLNTIPKQIVSTSEEESGGSPDEDASRNSSRSVLHAPEIHVTDYSLSQVDSTAQACSSAAWDHLLELSADSSPAFFDNAKDGSEEGPPMPEDEADHINKYEPEPDASEDGGSSGGSTAIALDPVEKEWLQGAASGNVSTLSHLLKQEPSLAGKKFTALHWAAKHGKRDMAILLVKAGADVNIRAHGVSISWLESIWNSFPLDLNNEPPKKFTAYFSHKGYTPLHIAALHGHRDIMELLILHYGAKQTVRDYSGHLPAHYLKLEGCPNGAIESPRLELQMVLEFQHLRGERRNRKLACLFLPKSSGSHSKKRWGSAEDLTEEDEKGDDSSHLNLPSPYRVRKFSR